MMTRVRSFGLSALLCCSTLSVYAQSLPSDATDVTNAYRLFMDIGVVQVSVPTVVEIPVSEAFLERRDFAVFDRTSGKFEPYLFLETTQEKPVSVRAEVAGGRPVLMTDGDAATYMEFSLPEDAQGQTRIILTGAKPVTSSALTILLDNFVALPKSIEIRVESNGTEKILVARRALQEQTVRFPKTTAQTWIVTLTYGQPLRITELRLAQEESDIRRTRTVRFLAQPSHDYRIYFDPDRFTKIPVGEAGNLSVNEDVLFLPAVPSEKNSAYIVADIDADGVADMHDNCVQTANADQKDIDGNGRGDACDDFDKDGLVTVKDNCPNNPNRNQVDTDGDGVGDACDGEESRITERNAWLPWAGMGFAAVVLLLLMVTMLKSKTQS